MKKMKIEKDDLKKAAESGIISDNQIEALWEHLTEANSSNVSFTGVKVAYYFGALIIISAMTWFATEAFADFSSIGLMLIAAGYFLGFFFVGKKLYENKTTEIPGGLLLTVSIFMVPLFVFSIQHYLGIWGTDDPGNYRDYYQWIKGGWFFMEITTIIVAGIFTYVFRFPFMTFPLAFTLWFLSMDLTPIIFGATDFAWEERRLVSLCFGLAMLIATFFIDRSTKKDYAFWLYLFGLICFWGGMSLMDSGSELGKLIYLCINILLVILSVLLKRKVFLVFGSLGIYGYLYHLSAIVFQDSMLFPVALSLVGLLIIWLGIKYNKHQQEIEKYLLSLLPESLLDFLPGARR